MKKKGLLSAGAVSSDLHTEIIGRHVEYFPVLSSTMDAARELVRKGVSEGTAVIAEEQTAGRGRLARTWLTPQGNIALSVVLFPRLAQLPEMIMLAALGVVQSIENVTGLKPGIKWPNDILLNGKKVCGILLETDARLTQGEQVAYVIIGIGINVYLQPDDFTEIASTATSLSVAAGKDVSRLAVVRALLQAMDSLYIGLNSGQSLYEKWRTRLVNLGQAVSVTSVDSVYEGIAESVERDGSLFVRCCDGELKRVVAGDVTLKNDGKR
jgi:BirA family transcriptional regulator, biotin operon repressor / biotin---[acetyl-CoA-carboxylase] ligase